MAGSIDPKSEAIQPSWGSRQGLTLKTTNVSPQDRGAFGKLLQYLIIIGPCWGWLDVGIHQKTQQRWGEMCSENFPTLTSPESLHLPMSPSSNGYKAIRISPTLSNHFNPNWTSCIEALLSSQGVCNNHLIHCSLGGAVRRSNQPVLNIQKKNEHSWGSVRLLLSSPWKTWICWSFWNYWDSSHY